MASHINQTPPSRAKPTYSNCELELERWPLKERGAVVVAASRQAVWPALLDVHAVDDFVVPCDLAHRGAAVPQEDGAEPSRERGVTGRTHQSRGPRDGQLRGRRSEGSGAGRRHTQRCFLHAPRGNKPQAAPRTPLKGRRTSRSGRKCLWEGTGGLCLGARA